DRSQRRARAANEGEIVLQIGPPSVTRPKLALYDRFHAFQAEVKGWPEHGPKDAATYADSFAHHPFRVEEWRYYVGRKLIGVGYVDPLAGPPEPVPGDGDEGRVPLPLLTGEQRAGGLS